MARAGRHRQPSGQLPGLSCQQLVELVSDYIDGELRAEDRARVESHLAACDACPGYVAQVRRLLDLTHGLDAEQLPPDRIDALTSAFRARHRPSGA